MKAVFASIHYAPYGGPKGGRPVVEESRGKGKSKSPRRGDPANCGRSRAGDMRVNGRSHMRLTAQGVACCAPTEPHHSGAKGAPPSGRNVR